ncbi:MAG: glycosyltransferase family 2 protein [Candidatus Hinthialibacter antarcticus]|nr:glycosyltransferase family 2 protein [Candidatus Hinthialibacter antarcticus]
MNSSNQQTNASQSSPPSFSVVTPSFNQAAYIRVNIESVLEQNYPSVEHVIADNQSTDGTIEVMKNYETLNWISEPDSGQSDAINKAIERSSNEWIVWVNSDDYLLPGALNKLSEYIQAHPDASVIYSNILFVDADGRPKEKHAPNYTPWKMLHWWWGALRLWQPGTVFKREVFDAVGPLLVDYHYSMDFDFFLKAQSRYRFHYFDDDLVAFRKHEEQKGHAGERTFIRERVDSTLNYWKRRNQFAFLFYRILLYFVEHSLLFVDGLRQLERGNKTVGWQLIWKGLSHNPLAIFRPEHAGFWVRKILGSERYYRLKSK